MKNENEIDRELKETLLTLLGIQNPQDVIIKSMLKWVDAVRWSLSEDEVKIVINHLSDAFEASGFTPAAYDKKKTREQLFKFLTSNDDAEQDRLIKEAKIARHIARQEKLNLQDSQK